VITSEVKGERVGERCGGETNLVAEFEDIVVGSTAAGIGGGGISWCSSDNCNQQKKRITRIEYAQCESTILPKPN